MNDPLLLRVRARLIAQLMIALVACACWRSMGWARQTFHTASSGSWGDSLFGGAIFASALIVLAFFTILIGFTMFPLIRRQHGPLLSAYGLPLAVPAVLFGPPLAMTIPELVGRTLQDEAITYIVAAMFAATAAWDFWAAIQVRRPQSALSAFLWMLAGEQVLLFLNWFQLYFE